MDITRTLSFTTSPFFRHYSASALPPREVENIPTLACNRPHPILEESPSLVSLVLDQKRENRISAWYRILELAYARNMTDQTDSLPTLSGLTFRFNTVLRDDYLAGIWKNDLFQSLLWHVADGSLARGMDSFARRKARAPTWSCLSLRRPVSVSREALGDLMWAKCSFDPLVLCEYLGHDIEPENSAAPYGRVRRGALTLRGPLQLFQQTLHQIAIYADDGRLTSMLSHSVNNERYGHCWG
ncbi:uncharacterized protein BDZ99DRAFT_234197 [Mytilinidion resinicola]|uniref:Uncharacterized protein n=1 Tax=Mytilinidion resinicola TaxID=574789 RepID=A0A6A6YZ95_9PEZI|nr:uncharacterized protein BDZ99DRAFT_234197 [Mytilinidion resinicola]KAF2814256.1 hypothetical protein BDZ99DRAFT_234197 [Mytilinidion resinicola]